MTIIKIYYIVPFAYNISFLIYFNTYGKNYWKYKHK